ncbi:MAG: diguanylate cyclase [Armatimonadota bacterium]|jgi:diguanylate cyclase (GGDEF)-like protein/PAS domain S-box-containing protein
MMAAPFDVANFVRSRSADILASWATRLGSGRVRLIADLALGASPAWLERLLGLLDHPAEAASAHRSLVRKAHEAGLTSAEIAEVYGALREALLGAAVESCRGAPDELATAVLTISPLLHDATGWMYEECLAAQPVDAGTAPPRADYRQLIESANDIILSVDTDGRFTFVNPVLTHLTGFTASDLTAQHLSVLVTATAVDRLTPLLREHRAGTVELSLQVKGNDEPLPVEANAIALYEDGDVSGHLIVARDIRRRKQAEESLHRRNEYLAAITSIAQAVNRSLDLADTARAAAQEAVRILEADYACVYLREPESRRFELRHHQGLAEQLPPGASRLEPDHALIAAADRTREVVFVRGDPGPLGDAIGSTIGKRPGLVVIVPLRGRQELRGVLLLGHRRSREFSESEIRLLGVIGGQIGGALDNAALYDAAKRAAVTDSLTGLVDHGELWRRLEAEAERSKRYDRALSFVIADLDNLKSINDTHGHMAGDAVLKGVAEILTATVRAADVVARYAGDEFALILPETSLERARMAAERVRANVASREFSVPGGGPAARATMTLGVAASRGKKPAAELVQEADKALYRAKANGGNAVGLGGVEP